MNFKFNLPNKLLCHGHHDTALTAAACSLKTCRGFSCRVVSVFCMFESQTATKLSLPPLAKYLPSGLHFSPHTFKKIS